MHHENARRYPGLILLTSLALILGGCLAEVGPEDPDPETLEQVNPSRSAFGSMPACGTVLATFKGTHAYSNGKYTATGYSCGGSHQYGYKYQCPEIVMRHFSTNWGFRWWGNAKDLLANAPKDKTNVYYNGDKAHPPAPGDALVWTKGTYGHVALITAVTSTSVSIIEQNWNGSGKATFGYSNGFVASRGNGWVPAGWVHAKANTSGGGTLPPGPPPPPTPPPPTPPPTPGVSWSCNKSSYKGQQLWTCKSGAIYICVGGKPTKKDCPHGCIYNPLGTNDTCKGGATPPPPPPPPPPTKKGNWQACASDNECQSGWCGCNNGTTKKCLPTPAYPKACKSAPPPPPPPPPGGGKCNLGSSGNNGDSCKGTPAETWRCVFSSFLKVSVSQVCRNGAWLNYHTHPKSCGSCCGKYSSACY